MGPREVLEWLPNFFYRFLLYVIQTVIRYGLMIWAFVDEFKKFYSSHSVNWRRDVSFGYMQRRSETLSKLPKHVGIVLVEEGDPDYSDLASLVIWAIAMGIPYVTMFERTGLLLHNSERITNIVNKKLKNLLGSDAQSINLVVNNVEHSKQNGFAHLQHIYLNFVAEEDGQQDIANASRELATKCMSGELKWNEIDESKVQSSLTGTKGLPDPELLIQFGSFQCLTGFLPWQVRLSEIINIRSHRRITFALFLDALQRYAGCQQRLGK